jgi:hypothetical protein
MTDVDRRESPAAQVFEPSADGATLIPTSPGTPGAVMAVGLSLQVHGLEIEERSQWG